jgi:hypothetical protein
MLKEKSILAMGMNSLASKIVTVFLDEYPPSIIISVLAEIIAWLLQGFGMRPKIRILNHCCATGGQ